MSKEESDLVSILKERYEYEIFRRNNFDNVLGIPITVVALLIGAITTIVFQNEVAKLFLLGSLVSVICISISILYLIRVFYGRKRKYDVLPDAEKIKQHYDDLVKFHIEDDSNAVNSSLNEAVVKWYVDCAKKNCEINDSRAESLHKSKLWVIFSLATVFLLVCYQILSRL
jgi:hypothetical protein